MKVHIGSTADGSNVSVDTASTSVLVIVGDQARGKTTLARYLARWWIADPRRSARAFADQPHQYADLPIEVRPLAEARTAAIGLNGSELTIIDGADSLAIATLCAHAHAPGLTILTSYGEAARALDDTSHLCLGLLGRHETDAAQGRLDWPSEVLGVIPHARGQRDFPVHRWQLVHRAAG